MMTRRLSFSLVSITTVLLASPALAQEQGDAPMPPAEGVNQDGGAPLLGGPEIFEEEEVGPSAFGGPDRTRAAAASVPPDRWLRLVRQIGLDDVQSAEVDRIEREFRDAQRAHLREHGEDLRRLAEARRAAQRDRQPIDPALARLAQEIEQESPKMADAQQEIWNLLDEGQQSKFRDVLAAEHERLREQRAARERAAVSGDEMMTSGDSMMTGEGADRRVRRSAAAGGAGGDGAMDERSQRRARFLRSLQKSRPAGDPPADADRRFRFDDMPSDPAEGGGEGQGQGDDVGR
jgi:hypothetical protein